jgi:hypothetical protein
MILLINHFSAMNNVLPGSAQLCIDQIGVMMKIKSFGKIRHGKQWNDELKKLEINIPFIRFV